MLELLSRLNGGELIGFVATVGGMLLAAIAILGGLWAQVRRAEFQARQTEVEAALKQDMLNRGMSADEIERVLNAGQPKASESGPPEQAQMSAVAAHKG